MGFVPPLSWIYVINTILQMNTKSPIEKTKAMGTVISIWIDSRYEL